MFLVSLFKRFLIDVGSPGPLNLCSRFHGSIIFMIFQSCENHQNEFQKYTTSEHFSLINRRQKVSTKQSNNTYFLDRLLFHFGVNCGPTKINKDFKNRSLARGVSGGAAGLIFDRFLVNFARFFDVFWSCFSSILKKLRDVHFVVSVCSFAFFCVCVCVVSCRVELCRVVSFSFTSFNCFSHLR